MVAGWRVYFTLKPRRGVKATEKEENTGTHMGDLPFRSRNPLEPGSGKTLQKSEYEKLNINAEMAMSSKKIVKIWRPAGLVGSLGMSCQFSCSASTQSLVWLDS